MGGEGFRLGVDFGTSNTTAVLAGADGRVRPLLFDGSPVLPSGVYAEPGQPLVVGRDAVYAARVRPDCFEPYPKRCIDDDAVLLGGVAVPVERLVAAVLGWVATQAVSPGAAVPPAVVTCPVGWGAHRQRRLLAAAGEVFPAVALAAEPVAAASYFLALADARLPVGALAVVYDLGAGTFDASVVRRTATGFDVVATAGLADAGGLDVDAAIMASLGGTYARRDPAAWQRLVDPCTGADRRASRILWDDVRTAKELLSRAATTLVHVPFFDDDAPLPREQVEQLARPVLERTVATTRALLAGAGVRPADLAGLFLVGGSSRMPLAASLLHRGLGVVPTVVEQPELAVAEGSLRAQLLPPPPPPPPAPDRPPTPARPPAPAPAVAGAAPAEPPAMAPPVAPPPVTARTGRRRAWLVASAVAVSLLGALLAVVVLDDRDRDHGGPTANPTATGATATAPSSSQEPPRLAAPRRVDVPNGGAGDEIRHVTMSPDGTVIAVVRKRSVRLYAAGTLKQNGDPIDYPGDRYWTATFSPDGRTLVTAADGLSTAAVRVWDVASRAYHGTLSDAFWTSCLAFGPTVKLFAVCDGPGSSVRLWNPLARRALGRVDSDNPATVSHVAFSPDGRTLATDGGNGTTLLWNVATRKRIGALPGVPHNDIPLTDPGAATAFSPDGKTLVVGGSDGRLTAWSIPDSKKLGQFNGRHGDRVAALAFSPDGRTLASLGGTTLRLWTVATRQPAAAALDDIADYYSALPAEFKGPELRFAKDGHTLTGCFDNHLLTWDLTPLTQASPTQAPPQR